MTTTRTPWQLVFPMTHTPVLQTQLGSQPVRYGKVRDIYDLGNTLLLVATDRISAFDVILPTGIPEKGRILTQLSCFWFEQLATPNHLITADLDAMGLQEMGLWDSIDHDSFRGRAALVRKTKVVPIECVVRGYLAGSGWKDYQERGTVCDVPLPAGLRECEQLPEPIFTPATKAEIGNHDENISFAEMVSRIGQELAEELRERSLAIYQRGVEHAQKQGILIADTKFEFGLIDGELILIDEVMTPDSSRFWPADSYQPGTGQPSFDKQFVRDWLSSSGWDKKSPPPELPDEIVAQTRQKYMEAYERLTGVPFRSGNL